MKEVTVGEYEVAGVDSVARKTEDAAS